MAKESILSRLRNKPEEVADEEGKLLKELMELRVQNAQGQLKETHKIREIRKSIAQLKTLSKEQEEINNND
jgi:large subunit ribosomal protein L29|tara:strand:+ start:413 stop:625 length:213 start_codon:yes stop_codon:yes gene_type:complete